MSFEEFLKKLGHLHDCSMTKFVWNQEEDSIELCFADIYWNFEGLPNYPGPIAGTISLTGVVSVISDFSNLEEGIYVSEVISRKINSELTEVNILFSPAGTMKVTCGHASFPELVQNF